MWFSDELPEPPRFARSRDSAAHKKAISWFKSSAQNHISKIWELVHFLREHGIHVNMIKTDAPGFVVYEDDHQVVAEVFRDRDF